MLRRLAACCIEGAKAKPAGAANPGAVAANDERARTALELHDRRGSESIILPRSPPLLSNNVGGGTKDDFAAAAAIDEFGHGGKGVGVVGPAIANRAELLWSDGAGLRSPRPGRDGQRQRPARLHKLPSVELHARPTSAVDNCPDQGQCRRRALFAVKYPLNWLNRIAPLRLGNGLGEPPKTLKYGRSAIAGTRQRTFFHFGEGVTDKDPAGNGPIMSAAGRPWSSHERQPACGITTTWRPW